MYIEIMGSDSYKEIIDIYPRWKSLIFILGYYQVYQVFGSSELCYLFDVPYLRHQASRHSWIRPIFIPALTQRCQFLVLFLAYRSIPNCLYAASTVKRRDPLSKLKKGRSKVLKAFRCIFPTVIKARGLPSLWYRWPLIYKTFL